MVFIGQADKVLSESGLHAFCRKSRSFVDYDFLSQLRAFWGRILLRNSERKMVIGASVWESTTPPTHIWEKSPPQ